VPPTSISGNKVAFYPPYITVSVQNISSFDVVTVIGRAIPRTGVDICLNPDNPRLIQVTYAAQSVEQGHTTNEDWPEQQLSDILYAATNGIGPSPWTLTVNVLIPGNHRGHIAGPLPAGMVGGQVKFVDDVFICHFSLSEAKRKYARPSDGKPQHRQQQQQVPGTPSSK
jgi:hypothetical protein